MISNDNPIGGYVFNRLSHRVWPYIYLLTKTFVAACQPFKCSIIPRTTYSSNLYKPGNSCVIDELLATPNVEINTRLPSCSNFLYFRSIKAPAHYLDCPLESLPCLLQTANNFTNQHGWSCQSENQQCSHENYGWYWQTISEENASWYAQVFGEMLWE